MVATLSQYKADEMPVCPVSGSRATEFLCEVNGFRIWRHPASGTDFVWPTPSDAFLRQMYDQENYFEGTPRGGYESYDEQTESVLPAFDDILARCEVRAEQPSILDIGCAYGTHLGIAAQRGWKAFGVEISRHALKVARERHGNRIFFVDSVDRLPPRQHDLILLLDVIEHLRDPYDLFLTLFHKGAIGPETQVAVTTPNARSFHAVSDPQHWIYRHPPTHLVYYSAESLRLLFKRLHFQEVEITGLYPSRNVQHSAYADEKSSLNDNLARYSGLLCQASGSDFRSFMKRCYVPGTWSRSATYKHISPYVFAKTLSHGCRVLDFGCGTGNGAALLAQVASHVFAIDSDAEAIAWARDRYDTSNLRFEQCTGLAAALPVGEYDIVTCFGALERLEPPHQKELIANLARTLTPEGRMIVKVTNPAPASGVADDATASSEASFGQLLREFFPEVSILRQWIRPSASIDTAPLPTRAPHFFSSSSFADAEASPAAFLAVCSHKQHTELKGVYCVDSSFDYDAQMLALEGSLNAIEQENYQGFERLHVIEEQLAVIDAQQKTIEGQRKAIETQQDESRRLQNEIGLHCQELQNKTTALVATRAEIESIKASRVFRLKETIRNESFGPRKLLKIAYLVVGGVTPLSVRRRLKPLVDPLKRRFARPIITQPQEHISQLQDQVLKSAALAPPLKIVHALTDFMANSASKSVVELSRRLGDGYYQEVMTNCGWPYPQAPSLAVREFSGADFGDAIDSYLRHFQPAVVHLHGRREAENNWYAQVVTAAQINRCRVIETADFPLTGFSGVLDCYVTPSRELRFHSLQQAKRHEAVYPGLDLEIFSPHNGQSKDNCVGIVCPLEPEILPEKSLDIFFQVLKSLPATTILIVGGGSYLSLYRQLVASNELGKSVKVLGYVPYRNLPEVYEQMSVFAAPFLGGQCYPTVVYAMSMGIPVAGYNVDPLAELIGDDELLSQPGDTAALAAKVVGLLRDCGQRRAIGKRNRERSQEFSVPATVRRYGELYRSLAG